VGLTTLPCKNKLLRSLQEIGRILWRRPRSKLGYGAKERRKKKNYLTKFKKASHACLHEMYVKRDIHVAWQQFCGE
jgi:hypothetical protein